MHDNGVTFNLKEHLPSSKKIERKLFLSILVSTAKNKLILQNFKDPLRSILEKNINVLYNKSIKNLNALIMKYFMKTRKWLLQNNKRVQDFLSLLT